MKGLSAWTSVLLPMVWLIFTLCGQTESRACSVSQFACADGEQCIPMSWKCDAENDCTDESDEASCDARACSENEFTCSSGQNCVPNSWKCDGENDCQDGSDELQSVCGNNTCTATQFACVQGNVTRCMPDSYRCDHVPDCPDGSDEQNCEERTCDVDNFRCEADHNCIPMRWVCDGEQECSDGSDERNCSSKTCAPDNFLCAVDNRCIPETWRCDGDMDCVDRTDEHNCSSTPTDEMCTVREFTCADRLSCIHLAWQCDGDEDCTDGSDEDECEPITCPDTKFSCGDGQCIAQSHKCDGHGECLNGRDEENCERPPVVCSASQFDCTADESGTECVSLAKVCDGNRDCMAGQDEAMCGPTRPCETMGCEGGCVRVSRNHSRCTCEEGYRLSVDGKSCEDIDECEDDPFLCTQVCHNTVGGYHCKCHEGYIWQEHHKICQAEGPEPQLIFANRVDLRRFGMHSGHLEPIVEGTKSAIALDFDYDEKVLVWSDVASEEILMVKMDPVEQENIESQVLVSEGTRTPDGLALDWVHHNLYWTDTGHNTLSVVHVSPNATSRHQRTLFETNMDEPRAIVVDPRHKQGWIYWTDWGNSPKIEQAGLDGSMRQVLYSDESTMSWPNGLTIDYDSNRLFWIDAKLQLIASVDLQGRNFHAVLQGYGQSSHHLQHPFAITVFEDFVYWSDWEVESITKVHKTHGGNVTALMTNLFSPMDLHVYHPYKQPAGVDVCHADQNKGVANGGCSHLCLPTPDVDPNSARFVCMCPDSSADTKYILVGGKTCRVEGAAPTDGGIDYIPTGKTTPGDIKPGSVTTAGPDGKLKRQGGNTPVGTIAAVVVGIFIVIIIIAAVIGFIVYRRYTRLGKRSMNFDNPVYRKTTEDQFSLEKNQYQPSKPVPSTLEPLTSSSNEYV